MIDNDIIIEIRKRTDIVELISEYIKVEKKGKNYVSVCPFHDDHSPSMVISPEKQMFKCFTCNTGGNVFTFLTKYENISFMEAVSTLAERSGIELNIKNVRKKTDDRYKKEHSIMEYAYKFYLNNINTEKGLSAKEYLSNRKIDDSIISEFGMGYSFNEKDSLAKFIKLLPGGYTDKDAENLGLVGINGIDVYDLFRNRIMIPISDIDGKVVGFTARLFNGEDQAKYINSRETVLFKKSEILFNYYNAKKYIRDKKEVIIVEGNMDAIKMSASGFKNVVALMGTSLSSYQVKMLEKLKAQITLILDNDAAGAIATIKNGDILLKGGIICNVVLLSDVKDPDEFIDKYGTDELLNKINKPINFIDYKLDYLQGLNDMSSTVGVSSFVKEVTGILELVDDVTKSVIISTVSTKYNISENLFSINKSNNNYDKRQDSDDYYFNDTVTLVSNKKDRYKILSSIILSYILNDVKYFDIYKNELNFLKTKDERDFVNEVSLFYKNNPEGSFPDFLTHVADNEKLNSIALDVASLYDQDDFTNEKFLEYLDLIKDKINKDEIRDLKYAIKAEIDTGKKMKLMNELTRLKRGCTDYE